MTTTIDNPHLIRKYALAKQAFNRAFERHPSAFALRRRTIAKAHKRMRRAHERIMKHERTAIDAINRIEEAEERIYHATRICYCTHSDVRYRGKVGVNLRMFCAICNVDI
jgi:uncharacterized sporulation protein YeaH/YhbH (DUF444 family)